jgi:hypothetical protein
MTGGGYLRTMPSEPGVQRVGRSSILALVFACTVLAVLVRPGVGSADRPACAEAVLDDWTRGTLDSHYSPECYEAAIDALPEDLRAYTTAADDIRRAAIAATRAVNASAAGGEPSSRDVAAEAAGDDALRAFPAEVAVLGVLLILLVSGGTTAAILRWRRGR